MVEENARPSLSESSGYEIRFHGALDERWSEWFDGIEITIEQFGDHEPYTTLTCPPMDQTKLRGMLNKIWDLNLNIISVRQVYDRNHE
jgi:hypothetical protein